MKGKMRVVVANILGLALGLAAFVAAWYAISFLCGFLVFFFPLSAIVNMVYIGASLCGSAVCGVVGEAIGGDGSLATRIYGSLLVLVGLAGLVFPLVNGMGYTVADWGMAIMIIVGVIVFCQAREDVKNREKTGTM